MPAASVSRYPRLALFRSTAGSLKDKAKRPESSMGIAVTSMTSLRPTYLAIRLPKGAARISALSPMDSHRPKICFDSFSLSSSLSES